MRVAIVGAGIAGLSCANFLRYDFPVVVFDEGRAPGGRTTVKKVGTARFDVAAPYFEVHTEAFRTAVKQWQSRGVAAPFVPNWLPGSFEEEDELWVGTPGMNAIARELAGEVDLRWGTPVTRVERDAEGLFKLFGRSEELGVFERVVVALPATEARAFVKASGLDPAALQPVKTAGVWSVSCEFAEAAKVEWNAGRWRDGKLRLVVRESAKPERSPGEQWMAYSAFDWFQEHLMSPAGEVAAELGGELQKLVGASQPPSARAWSWPDAVVVHSAGKPTIEIDDVFFCGDWCNGGGVEGAWKSGVLTAQRISRGE